jgi:hypothetical protein
MKRAGHATERLARRLVPPANQAVCSHCSMLPGYRTPSSASPQATCEEASKDRIITRDSPAQYGLISITTVPQCDSRTWPNYVIPETRVRVFSKRFSTITIKLLHRYSWENPAL